MSTMFCIFDCIVLIQVFFLTSETACFYQKEDNRSDYSSATINLKNSYSIRKDYLWRNGSFISVLSHRKPFRLRPIAQSKLLANIAMPFTRQTTRIFTGNQGNEFEDFNNSKIDASSNPLLSRKSHGLIRNRSVEIFKPAAVNDSNGKQTDTEKYQRDAIHIGFVPSLSGKWNFKTNISLHLSGPRSALEQELTQRKGENSGLSGKHLAGLQAEGRLKKRALRPSFHREVNSKSDISSRVQRELDMDFDCLALFMAGHKYFGFDPRKGSELSWKYGKKGFYTSFPRPRLKQLHPMVVELCSHGTLRCVMTLANRARMTSIMINTIYSSRQSSLLPYYHPFKSAVDLFRFRTTASYYLCWLALTRSFIMEHLNRRNGGLCIKRLDRIREQFGNEKHISDYRQDDVPFQCALVNFCPDPCFGRKTKGMVPTAHFAKHDDPGNPCRGLRDKTCKWLLGKPNSNFEDLQRNRFNISCACESEQKGFAWDSKYHLCVDVDECQAKAVRDGCSRRGKRCQNLPGRYECVCRTGQVLDPLTSTCRQKVQVLRPTVNETLLEARYLRKMMQSEGTGTFLKKQLENFLGLSRGCCSVSHLFLHGATIALSILMQFQ